MSPVRRTLALSFAENYTVMFISFAGSLVLARILTPTDIGVFSVGAVLVGLAHIMRDFGVGQYIIQEKELTEDRIRAAMTVTLVLGWSMAALLAVLSVPAAIFYAEPGVRNVMLVLAANFMLIPFGTVAMAYMRREMKFGALYWVRSLGSLAHTATAIGLAFMGLGYMSLAWSSMVGIAMTVLLTGLLRPAVLPWLPGRRELPRVLRFGSFLSGASIVNEMGRGAPDLIIGKLQSMEAVGFFGRANGMVDLFNRLIGTAISTVATPYFAAQNRAGEDLAPIYLRIVHLVSGISWTFFAFVGIMAYPLINLLFGSQWNESVPVARILCFWAALASTFRFSGQLFIALGEVKIYAQLQFLTQLLRVAFILASAPFGLEAVAASIVISSCLGSILTMRRLRSLAGIRALDIFKKLLPSGAVALSSSLGPITTVAIFGLESERIWLVLALAGAGAALGWLTSIYVLKHGISGEVDLLLARVRGALKK
ncbi:MAG TPA: lipopolysaccharide biosynthesis protein [Burkholderiales bacterium]|nr:lipopolysaccharide biosynthesis protein [Burkholderiales bacterium]